VFGVSEAAAEAARIRAAVPSGASVAEDVAAILADVRSRGDAAVAEYEARFAGERLGSEPDAELRAALKLAAENIAVVARAGLGEDVGVTLPQGHTVTLREVPVRRAAVYAPGGRAPYPSSVLMGVVTARVAGVEEVVAVVPSGHPVMRAAAEIAGADEIHEFSGAQAVGALAYGTETVRPVDVIAGPGNLYVQEAKRQVSGIVGIDGFAGPSDLVVIASGDADAALVELDLAAQAEHGEGTVVVAVSDDADLLSRLSTGERLHAESLEAALAFAEAFAPEHLQLMGAAAEALAPRVRRAGCLFVGTGTAFGDYVAGSNHTLPTEGAARFASGLNVRHFRRRMSEVRIPQQAAAELARAGVKIAEAEGFEAHAKSMSARMEPR
jgi:histidinol dehydrogenase